MNNYPSQPPQRGGVLLSRFYLLFLLLLLSSCSIFRYTKSIQNQNNVSCKPSEASDSILTTVKNTVDHYPQFQWLSAKASTAASVNGESNSFTTHFRIRKDSLIWISAGISAIEGARVLLSPDSIKFMDRLHNTFYVGTYAEIENIFHARINFYLAQAVLTTNLAYYLNDSIKNQIKETNQTDSTFILTTYKDSTSWFDRIPYSFVTKNKNEKNKLSIYFPGRDQSTKPENDPPSLNINFLNENCRIASLYFYEMGKSLLVEYLYSDTKTNTESLLPLSMTIKYFENVESKAKEDILISLSFDRMETDKALEFPFKIPASYKSMK